MKVTQMKDGILKLKGKWSLTTDELLLSFIAALREMVDIAKNAPLTQKEVENITEEIEIRFLVLYERANQDRVRCLDPDLLRNTNLLIKGASMN